MRWLASVLGIDRLLEAEVIQPTEEYFPDPYHGMPADVRRIMQELAEYMDVDSRKIELEVCPDIELPGAAGLYEPGERRIIRVAVSQTADLQRLAATLIHELSHEVLLGGGLLSTAVEDHEWITDLLAAYLGLGIFAANSAMHEHYWTTGTMTGWVIGKQGYLPARVFGYAFALFCFMRQEEIPSWVSLLRLDASAPFREGLRYLNKTRDSLFHPDTIRDLKKGQSVNELITQLERGTPSFRLAALWECKDQGPQAAKALDAVVCCLADRDPDIPGEAARTLAAFGPAASPALPNLQRLLRHEVPSARAGAAYALGVLGLEAETIVPELAVLLDDKNGTVVSAAAQALSRYGRHAELAADRLLGVLASALVECDHALIETLVETLRVVTSDPDRSLWKYFNDADPDLLKLALQVLRDQEKAASQDTGKKPAP
jgi:hypothetical protein